MRLIFTPALVALLIAMQTAATASATSHPSVTASAATQVPVSRVVDGDTLHAGGLTVRVLGIDTPETVKPGTPVQCGGPQASAFAHQVLDGQRVTLTRDPTQADRDRYGRALRYVRLSDGRDYSQLVVSAGWARVYTYKGTRVGEYARLEAAQREAVAARRGLWGACPNPAPGD